jgi:hypothetical protein
MLLAIPKSVSDEDETDFNSERDLARDSSKAPPGFGSRR